MHLVVLALIVSMTLAAVLTPGRSQHTPHITGTSLKDAPSALTQNRSTSNNNSRLRNVDAWAEADEEMQDHREGNWTRRKHATYFYPVHPLDRPVNVPHAIEVSMKPGQMVFIHGTVRKYPWRFSVNLQKGVTPYDGDLVNLHISMRFKKDNTVILNSQKNNVWGKETIMKNPFYEKGSFDVRIRTHRKVYDVFLNRRKVASWECEMGLSEIRHFTVDGAVYVDGMMQGGGYHDLPYILPLQKWNIGGCLFVKGFPLSRTTFHIDFYGDSDNILFSFEASFSKTAILLNSRINEKWGREDRGVTFPFSADEFFDLAFVNEPHFIEVFNGKESIATFAHRTQYPDNAYTRVRFSGGVEIVLLDEVQNVMR